MTVLPSQLTKWTTDQRTILERSCFPAMKRSTSFATVFVIVQWICVVLDAIVVGEVVGRRSVKDADVALFVVTNP